MNSYCLNCSSGSLLLVGTLHTHLIFDSFRYGTFFTMKLDNSLALPNHTKSKSPVEN